MVKLDCRKFKEKVLKTIEKLRSEMQAHLVLQFRRMLEKQVVKNREMWNLVSCVHEGIDEIISQIDLI